VVKAFLTKRGRNYKPANRPRRRALPVVKTTRFAKVLPGQQFGNWLEHRWRQRRRLASQLQ
jgi:hypothetical protein